MRFAGSSFHQGGVKTDCAVYIRVILGRKIGVASTNSLERSALVHCLDRALRIAEHVSEEGFPLLLPGPSVYADIGSYFVSTASMDDAEKVSVISEGFKRGEALGVLHSGILSTSVGEIAVFNTNGVEAYHPYTSAFLSSISTGEGSSGFSSALSKDISSIDILDVMEESADSCLKGMAPRDLATGVYRVLLEPPAVCELLHWLAYIGFGAKNYHEGSSFLSGRLGEKITGENVTIYDDGADPRGMAVPFDLEGVGKRKTMLIERGAASGVVYDTFTASLDGRGSTGHAPFPEDPEGPLPDHVFMEGGSCPRSEMVERLGEGIVVKSFHYVNGLLNPKQTLMTGMTRHGTFYVDNGKVLYPVRSLRFTENILEAFGRIEEISREVKVFPNHDLPLSSITAPYLLIDGFRFTG
ncbi:MAG: TldD/PmbA family protein [Deltaproteobacteria bacterium]|nr:TldD/PmbA family protein [Deltaproteobacteria bacterium]